MKITYWFSKEDGTTEHQKLPAEIGRTDSVGGEIIPCKNGLHSGPTPWDALQYACGPVLWEVEVDGDVTPHGNPVDKYASRTRKYSRKANAGRLLRQFAAQQALGVINLWAAPEIVVQYLQDEAKGIDRSDIRVKAWAAAWAVVFRDAAEATVRDAAKAAAWGASWDEAWAAARAVAGPLATWDATRESFNKLMMAELAKKV